MNEKVRSRVQAAEMGFLRRISGLILLGKVKTADIRESLNRIAVSSTKKIAAALAWTCEANVPGKNNPKLLCSTTIG